MKKNVLNKNLGAPAGIRTRVFGSKGRNDWPDYTTGARCILQRDLHYMFEIYKSIHHKVILIDFTNQREFYKNSLQSKLLYFFIVLFDLSVNQANEL